MKPMPASVLCLSALLILASCQRPAEEAAVAPAPAEPAVEPTSLFNGTDLSGWGFHLVDDSAKPEDVWRVDDGVIICAGNPYGYLRTESSYQDFTLSLEWRWAPGKEPGNSGVLLRIAGEPTGFMPKCVEAQLKSESAGDIWAFRGASVAGAADRIAEVKGHADLGDFIGVRKIKAAENPPGEWNHYEIKVTGSELSLAINGETVNEATGLDIVSGPIGLQSEGAEIHFRKLSITPH
jgi:hypothetical protein